MNSLKNESWNKRKQTKLFILNVYQLMAKSHTQNSYFESYVLREIYPTTIRVAKKW